MHTSKHIDSFVNSSGCCVIWYLCCHCHPIPSRLGQNLESRNQRSVVLPVSCSQTVSNAFAVVQCSSLDAEGNIPWFASRNESACPVKHSYVPIMRLLTKCMTTVRFHMPLLMMGIRHAGAGASQKVISECWMPSWERAWCIRSGNALA